MGRWLGGLLLLGVLQPGLLGPGCLLLILGCGWWRLGIVGSCRLCCGPIRRLRRLPLLVSVPRRGMR